MFQELAAIRNSFYNTSHCSFTWKTQDWVTAKLFAYTCLNNVTPRTNSRIPSERNVIEILLCKFPPKYFIFISLLESAMIIYWTFSWIWMMAVKREALVGAGIPKANFVYLTFDHGSNNVFLLKFIFEYSFFCFILSLIWELYKSNSRKWNKLYNNLIRRSENKREC